MVVRQRPLLFLPLALLLLCVGPIPAAHAADTALTLGVLEYRDEATVRQQWSSVIDRLNDSLPERFRLRLLVLPPDRGPEAIRREEVDLVLANPAHYATLHETSVLGSPIATLVRGIDRHGAARAGGVLIRRAESSDLRTRESLRDRRVAIMGGDHSGGYLPNAWALQQRGIDLDAIDFVRTPQSQGEVVDAVLDGRADAGFIRTGVLESLVDAGRIDPGQIRVIEPVVYPMFPHVASTRLLPEWPVAARRGLSQAARKAVAAALYSLDPADPDAGIQGFALPADYGVVRTLMQDLRIPPFDEKPAFNLGDVWDRYWLSVVIITGLAGLVLVLLGLIGLFYYRQRRLNRRLNWLFSRLQGVVAGTRAGTWEWHVPSGRTHFNERWAEMLGHSLAELEPTSIDTWNERVHPDDLVLARHQMQRHFAGEIDFFEVVIRMWHRDGHWIWVYDRGQVRTWTADGEPEWVSGTHIDDTARHRLTEAERELYEQFREFTPNVPGVLFQFRIDENGQYVFPFVSERVDEVVGCSAEEAIANPASILDKSGSAYGGELDRAIQRSANELSQFDFTYPIDHPVKGERWLHARSTPARDANGGVTWHGYLEDVTEVREANGRLEQAAEVFNATEDGIIITDEEHRIVEVNRASNVMLGYSSTELEGQLAGNLFPPTERDAVFPLIIETLDHGGGVWRGDVRLRSREGDDLDVEVYATTLNNKSFQTVRHVAVLHDISERILYEQRLKRLANFDLLTGLPNRRLLSDRLGQASAQAQRSGETFAVCMLDLDRFKPVNDTYGHQAGDQVLARLGERLEETLRDEDTVARFGGDEFLILVRDYKADHRVFERILEAVSRAIYVEAADITVEVGGSLGVAVFDATAPVDGDQLIRRADQAVYRAKSLGGQRTVMYSDLEENSGSLA
ncbi:diguanylate cyclase domain-containing protein [Spiribacter vilamensis]|uniref:PAS domain S-box-containing protein/diguanylate cyclase (GGDEF)-like protein n=1 Tax=Spiribacter vilamensis TaxID=531306 RepID=A0A4Q8D059_9GAMM|nr:diguanylate cyclase [Spiribacter vilamensis]RZU98663.1 PAS domain S-box-containing protein/diguanylate cyclase (GGDEF)-like protein [Spiribacter vilamensis]TVO60080.1 diguanylate cyclase [Spiribacter vilamensis]